MTKFEAKQAIRAGTYETRERTEAAAEKLRGVLCRDGSPVADPPSLTITNLEIEGGTIIYGDASPSLDFQAAGVRGGFPTFAAALCVVIPAVIGGLVCVCVWVWVFGGAI